MTPSSERREPKIKILMVAGREAIERLHALVAEYEADLPPVLRHGSSPTISEVETSYAKPNGAFLALVDDAAAGCVAFRRVFDDATPVMMRLYVTRAFRGRGIARLLVVALINRLSKAGYARVVLDTDKDQLPAAYALYRSLGFTECDPYGPVDYPSPTYMSLQLK